MKDLFGNKIVENKSVHVNIYADEVQSRHCKISNSKWHYIGLIIEDTSQSLLQDIITERYLNNFDTASPYHEKNNKIVHWCEIHGADQKNICKRWIEYVLNPNKSHKKFYSYVLGLNDSYLIREEFDTTDDFNSKYNRFFRSAVVYSLKTFFGDRSIVVDNIFHEEGQQQNNEYFPWHCIYKISQGENINFGFDRITFLPKDHKLDPRSNLIQLCDSILGLSTSIIHGIEKSKTSKYREELADLYFPLFYRMVHKSRNKNSSYKHHNRMITRFFPKEKTNIGDYERLKNQFFTRRTLNYQIQKSGQLQMLFK